MMTSQDIPADELKELQGLLQLKNYEKPADGYHEDFLEEFHRRQRAENLQAASKETFAARFGAWFDSLGSARWAIGAAGAYAALTLAFFALPDAKPASGLANENEEILPGDRRLEHVELEKEVENPEKLLEILPSEF